MFRKLTAAVFSVLIFTMSSAMAAETADVDSGINKVDVDAGPADLILSDYNFDGENLTLTVENIGGLLPEVGPTKEPKIFLSWRTASNDEIDEYLDRSVRLGPENKLTGWTQTVSSAESPAIQEFLELKPDNATRIRVRIFKGFTDTYEVMGNNTTYVEYDPEYNYKLLNSNKPNLTISNVQYDGLNLSYTIENKGGATVGTDLLVKHVWANVNGTETPGWQGLHEPVYINLGQILAEKSSIQISTDDAQYNQLKKWIDDGHQDTHLKISVDSENYHDEFNESNNVQLILRPLPDYAVTDISADAERLTFSLVNQGEGVRPKGYNDTYWNRYVTASYSWRDENGNFIDGSPSNTIWWEERGHGITKTMDSEEIGGLYNAVFTQRPENAETFRISIDFPNINTPSYGQHREENEDNNIVDIHISAFNESGGSVQDAIEAEENISADDLGINEPRVLPGSPLYIFKSIGRGVVSMITFNTEKQIALNQKIASQKILETQALIKKGEINKAIQHLGSYEKELDKASTQIEKLDRRDSRRAEELIEKGLKEQVIHQTVLANTEKAVSPERQAEVSIKREDGFKKMANLIEKVADINKQAVIERSVEVLKKKHGRFTEIKTIEILNGIKDQSDESVIPAIELATEKSAGEFKKRFEKLDSAEKEQVIEYAEKIAGNKERISQSVDVLAEKLEPDQRVILERSHEGLLEALNRPETRRQEADDKRAEEILEEEVDETADVSAEPEDDLEFSSGDESDGGTVEGGESDFLTTDDSDESSTIEETPATEDEADEKTEPTFCTAEYRPVCGADNKTYSNRCVAEQQNKVRVQYEGECRSVEEKTEDPVREESVQPSEPEPEPEPVCNSRDLSPVCGTDDKTYTNECFATEAKVRVQYTGECKVAEPEPVCNSRDLSPVCGTDDKTYTNECFATEAKVRVQYEGECKTATR